MGCKIKAPFPAPAAPTNPVDQLPPATQTGRRTFGCLVNGQAWTPVGSPFAGPIVSANYMNSRLAIVVNRDVIVNRMNSFHRISLVMESLNSTGNYMLNDSTQRFARYENFDNGCKLVTTALQTGTIELTKLDPVARIAAGRFSFTLENPGCSKVTVTDGRFDVSF